MTILYSKTGLGKYIPRWMAGLLLNTMILLMISAAAAGVAMGGTMDISYQDDLISVELVDVPLIDVLQRIKQDLGLKVHFHGNLNDPVTLSFTELSLGKALRLLVGKKHSLSIVSQSDSGIQDRQGGDQIAEVWILSGDAPMRGRLGTPAVRGRQGRVAVTPVAKPHYQNQPEGDNVDQTGVDGEENLSPEEILNDPNTGRAKRRQVVQELIRSGDPSSIMTMASFLDNEDKEFRRLLVNGISSVESEEATQVLGLVFQEETDQDIRKIALWALGKRKDDAAARAVLQQAKNDPDKTVQTLAEQLLKSQ